MSYRDVCILKSALSSSRSPTAVRIQIDTENGSPSFEFGKLVNGRIESVRYWKGERALQLAVLARYCGELEGLNMLGGGPVGALMAQYGLPLGVDAVGELPKIDTPLKKMPVQAPQEPEKKWPQQPKRPSRFGATIADRMTKKGV